MCVCLCVNECVCHMDELKIFQLYMFSLYLPDYPLPSCDLGEDTTLLLQHWFRNSQS